MMLLPMGNQIELKTMLLYAILNAQIAQCTQDGTALTFDTPAMRALLRKLEQVDFSAYPAYGKGRGYGYNWGMLSKSLFSESYDLGKSEGRGADGCKLVPMVLSLDEHCEPTLPAEVSAFVLSPTGKNNPPGASVP